MKYLLTINLIILQVIFNCVEASESSKTGFSIDDSRSITIRHITENNHAFDIGVRFGKSHYEYNEDFHIDSTTAQLVLGYRKYINKEKIDHFYGANVILYYADREDSDNLNGDVRSAQLEFIYGLEYFITDNISIEGRAGIGISYYDYSNNDTTSRSFTIPITGVGVNYYW